MRALLFAVAICAIAIGCSGGSSSSPPSSSAPQSVSVNIRVGVPSALVTANVESVVVKYVPVGEVVPPATPPLVINVASGSSDCTVANGATTCGGTLTVPLGQQNFTITLYSGANGTGTQIAVKSFTANVQSNGQTIDISSASGAIGIVNTIQLTITPNVILAGTPSQFSVSVSALDASGKAITTPYNGAITIVPPPAASPGQPPILQPPAVNNVSVINPNGTVLLLATGPGELFTFSYTGTQVNLPSAFTFSASGANAAPVTAQLSVMQPTPVPTQPPSPPPTPVPTLTAVPTPPPGAVAVTPNALFFEAPNQPAQTFTAAEAGYTTFTAVSADPTVATVSASGTTFSVTPVGVGKATITVTDAAGGTGTVFAYVTQSSVIISGRRRHT